MRLHNGRLGFAPTDLGRFLACRRLTSLSRNVTLGKMPAPPVYPDPHRDAAREAGREHEEAVRKEYGGAVLTIEGPDQETQTLEAMRHGVEVIHQGRFIGSDFVGYPDFLLRVERESRLGGWSYEVEDAKLALASRADAVLQVAVYSWLLEAAQGAEPEQMHLRLGDGTRETFRVADFAAFERTLRQRFVEHYADPGAPYPEPVPFCGWCHWSGDCQNRLRQDDHLSFVAGAARHQRHRLTERGITTLAGLARLPLPLDPPLDGVHPTTFARIHRQAAVQLEGRERGVPYHERIPAEENRGLLALPEPSPGDLFFDIEATRPGPDGALEYLFGTVDREGTYDALWALDRDEERRMFERFMDMVAERRERFPDLHIYHYGGYETGALKRLMSRYATREDSMDVLLRQQVFVDLLQVVKQGIVASVESYSLKSMEPFFGFVREQPLVEANQARARWDVALESGKPDAEDREIIRRYNREDCLATLRLHDWLETERAELSAETGPQPRPEVEISAEKEEQRSEAAARVENLAEQIIAGDPENPTRQLLGFLLDYHRREDKSGWWEYFRLCDLDAEELIEDRSALGGLEYEGEIGQEKRSKLYRYRFPSQEHGVRAGQQVVDPETRQSPGEVAEVSESSLVLKRGPKVGKQPHPRALVFHGVIPSSSLRDSLFRLGETVAESGFADASPRRAAFDLLRRTPPRGGARVLPGEDTVAAARRIALRLDREVLAVQGPPGSGKTWLGARIATALLAAGKRVGVTAQSHRVITNLLDAVARAADEEGVSFRGIQITNEEGCQDSRIEVLAGSGGAESADPEVRILGGTSWVWTRKGMADSVDVLLVDEAGQFPLANALGCAQAAQSLVLLGDPRQLDQVTQAIHPEGSEASALGHLLGGERTLAPGRGLFLSETWRMHPEICRFTSELFYEGRLGVRPGLERQEITGGPLPGAGLRFVPVEHQGNTRESAEEARQIQELISGMLAHAKWTDAKGTTRPLTPEDILIVAPYNAQVERLQEVLGENARVGTVDKFQGQEAAAVFYSMATSTSEEAPRGMDFLYSLNRLNVATSRARCLAVVVASPELFFPECHSPHQMRLANAFCRFRELAAPMA